MLPQNPLKLKNHCSQSVQHCNEYSDLVAITVAAIIIGEWKAEKSRNIVDCTVYTAIVMVNDSKCAKSELMIEYREQCEHPNLQPRSSQYLFPSVEVQ